LAELNDVLGAIVRDVAQARVIGDLFSRNVSLDYQQDELLRNFPVPRVEIKQASIDLRFAVNDVERKEVDPESIARARLPAYAAELAREAFSEFIETDPRGEELAEVIQTKGLALETQLPFVIQRTLSDNLPDLMAALENRPERIARKLQGEVAGLLLGDDDVKEVMTRGTRVADVREAISVAAASAVDAFAREVPRDPAGGVDVDALPRDAIEARAARLGDTVTTNLVLANPRRTELLKAAAESGVQLDRSLRETAERVLLEDPKALKVALEGEPGPLVERLESELAASLLGEAQVRTVMTRRVRITDFRTRVGTLVSPSIASFAAELKAAIAAAQRQAVTVDVAVKTADLANLPENVVSQITVVAEIKNYELIEGEGAGLPRLQPE
jgi:hypothetical protein